MPNYTAPIVKLVRGQINSPNGIDTTVKSSSGWARSFAPTWDMVVGHKQGCMTDEEYTTLYPGILTSIPIEVWRSLYSYGRENSNEAHILCYCRNTPDKFCHTTLLINYAVERFPRAFSK